MARLAGLEPATYGLEGCCSIQLSYRRIRERPNLKKHLSHDLCFPLKNGRDREIRTPDILHPKQARYQTALYPEYSAYLFIKTTNK